ncbi:MAG: FAD/NAD(P)-binding protein [Hamadaea sp.]|nr:FAD/NAD(P)-binding protein [Hamadaea sp.]
MTGMLPLRYRVDARHCDTADVTSVDLVPQGPALARWSPGQFTMVYAVGIGEVPISVSGGDGARIVHTVRAVGAVSRAICAAPVGTVLGLRGPFGRGWSLPDGGDLVIVGGGIGLAPLRPLVRDAIAQRNRFGSIDLLVGARTPEDLLFAEEADSWRAASVGVHVTVDRATPAWPGDVGVVTALLPRLALNGPATTAYVCGPEIMMRLVARDLADRGVPKDRIQLSLERNMRCGYGVCGHCQLGPMIVCRDGPVTDFGIAGPLLSVREL